jgi:hypothetical protein
VHELACARVTHAHALGTQKRSRSNTRRQTRSLDKPAKSIHTLCVDDFVIVQIMRTKKTARISFKYVMMRGECAFPGPGMYISGKRGKETTQPHKKK